MATPRVLRATNRRTRTSLPADFTLDHDETTRHRLRKLALDPRIDELIIDGRTVREVSSRALGLLVAVTRLADARGAVVTLIDPSPELAASIDRRGLAQTLRPDVPLAAVTPMWPSPGQMTAVTEPVD